MGMTNNPDSQSLVGADSGTQYSLGAYGGSESYNPSAVQAELKAFFAGHTGSLTEYENFFVMYLMQEYGTQVAGNDANLQGHMNQYFSQIQSIWNTLYSADSSSESGSNGAALYNSFTAQCQQLWNEVNSDPFFTEAPGRSGMQSAIENTIQSIQNIAAGASAGPGAPGANLYNLWMQYDPGTGSGTAQGNPGPMSNLMRQLGQLNQQVTGESQGIAADTKADVQLLQTEQDSWNNWGKAINKLVMYMEQQQRTG